jgi:hypothetical protein
VIANPIAWPNGARCACCLTFDMDADSLIHQQFPNDGYRRVSAISMLRYGPMVAVPRIVETYRRLGIRQTFFVPAWCIEQYPRAIESMLAGDNELAHHGYIHEHPVAQTREDEAHWLDRGIEIIERVSGRRPSGWRAPLYTFSDNSLDLLLERGFTYDASLMGDDLPYVLESRASGGRLIELPSHWGLDDWPQYVQSFDLDYMMPVRAPSQGFEIYRQEFQAAYRFGTLWVPVIHPFASGRLARWSLFADFLEEVVSRGDVWFAPLRDIAAVVQTAVDQGQFNPQVERLPQYSRPIGRVLPRGAP